MHAHIESLPARRHLSATLDPSFGTGGVARPGHFAERTLAIGNAVFVESDTYAPYAAVQKLTEAGVLDTTWGDKGTLLLPFDTFDAWAYDTRLGRLIVGGHDLSTAKVLRLDTAGRPDASFGDDGIYTYTPPLPSTQSSAGFDGVGASAVVESLATLPHGQLLVGLRREQSFYQSTYDPEAYTYRSTDTKVDVSLLKIRGNGSRQINYGRRGLRTLLSGREVQFRGDFGDTDDTDVPHLAAVTPTADGGMVVTLTRSVKNTEYILTFASRFDVIRRRVDAGGTIDPTADAEWNLVNDADPDGERGIITTFEPLLVQPIDDGVRVVGRSRRGGENWPVAAFDLRVDRKPVARAIGLPLGATLTAITPTRRGYLAVGRVDIATGGYQPYAVRLNDRLRPVASWGDNGAVSVPVGEVTFDLFGRLLLTDSPNVSRLIVTTDR